MTAQEVRTRALELILSRSKVGAEGAPTLGECGMDSLDIADLELAVEAEWSVSVPGGSWGHDTPINRVVQDVLHIVGASE